VKRFLRIALQLFGSLARLYTSVILVTSRTAHQRKSQEEQG
jgi:hypothetical protein